MHLTLIGIGTGNPEHMTLQAIRAMNAQDVILIPKKGVGKADLAELREAICAEMLSTEQTTIIPFDLPVRDETTQDYLQRVDEWHDAIALAWQDALASQNNPQRVALLVWGDPSLYDSTLRIAARLNPQPTLEVIPGITSLQALTAAHAIPINQIGSPFVVTTGRRLRDEGWPQGQTTIAVMLDGNCSFQTLKAGDYHIWWGGYVGMKEQITCQGPLAEVSDQIVQLRAEAREKHGWIMDIYVLRRRGAGLPRPACA